MVPYLEKQLWIAGYNEISVLAIEQEDLKLVQKISPPGRLNRITSLLVVNANAIWSGSATANLISIWNPETFALLKEISIPESPFTFCLTAKHVLCGANKYIVIYDQEGQIEGQIDQIGKNKLIINLDKTIWTVNVPEKFPYSGKNCSIQSWEEL